MKKLTSTHIVLTFLTLLLFHPKVTFAAQQNANVLSEIAFQFQQKASAWQPVIEAHALSLFRILLIGSIAWMGITSILKQEDFKSVLVNFIRLIFFTCLMLAVLKYYTEWANMLISGLSGIATELNAPPADPSTVFVVGMKLIFKILDKISLMKPVDSLGLLICSLAIAITFALIAAQMLLVKCESYIVLNAGIILLGFGGAEQTRSYATNFLRYSLGVAAKLFVMQLLISLGTSFINDIGNATILLQDLFILIGASIVLLALTMSIPDIVSGIINGAHVSTGQAITSAASTVAMGTMATMGAIKASGFNTFDGVQATRAAAGMANADGVSGLSKAGHMARNLGSAAMSTRGQGRVQNIRSAIHGKSELQDLMNSAEVPSTPPMEDKPYESPAVDLTLKDTTS
ncbi:P-type conjugative transfer protein TrbL [Halodesulfovibrio marinisediminis]|uniref:Type IV secretion system protein TrbL n=1 Tax=Halodesulfovibrio marinisediminis DSM 17456 TaxID=1121457 RepID=A0A1N6FF15_9BACT|nr:P-type conjugative transfer protein TrbL [Halodesulfovibrio marinisediminis]SIN93852.1 type IV secretion system protein TrbL [Halodesulfovibrio marinisediminis DSM 17456]